MAQPSSSEALPVASRLASRLANREVRLLQAALKAHDYRTFISEAIIATAKDGAKPNIAAVSRKAGFSSRSFIGDVIDGKKRLSAKSYLKLTRAFSLTPRLKTYFHLLVISEEPEINVEGLSSQEIESRLRELRSRFLSQLSTADLGAEAKATFLRGRDMMDCYAALGSTESGATLEQIAQRTGFPIDFIQRLLGFFIERGVVACRDERYFATNPLLFFKDLGSNQGARSCYLQTLDELKRKANAGFHAPDRAFYQYVYSIDQARLPELKQRLWEVLQEFVETSESAEGDAIVKLVLGMYV